jgi:geranylgeranyl reductase family protein
MVSYDVIVVGAGPAGSIAAHDCAAQGLKTLLLEKCALPRDKPCGGAVTYRGLEILKGELPPRLVERRIYGMRFLLPSGKKAEFISDKIMGITTMRSRFDEYLARRAVNSGAELIEQARVVAAQVTDDFAAARLSDGREFTSRLVIGADGVNSVVSRSLDLRPQHNDLTRVGLGMEADFEVGEDGVMKATQGRPDVLEIAPVQGKVSYGWVFPKKEHLGIGIAGAAAHMYPLRPAFDGFIRTTERRLGVRLPPGKRRTYFLGADGLAFRNTTKRAMLVGDAAGFVDPMMGEGIAYAMKSGVFAARVAVQAAEQDRYDDSLLSKYDALCHKQFGASFGMVAWVGMRGTSFAEFVLSRASGYRIASDVMVMLARGEIGYSNTPATVLRRLPRELPSILRRYLQTRREARYQKTAH